MPEVHAPVDDTEYHMEDRALSVAELESHYQIEGERSYPDPDDDGDDEDDDDPDDGDDDDDDQNPWDETSGLDDESDPGQSAPPDSRSAHHTRARRAFCLASVSRQGVTCNSR